MPAVKDPLVQAMQGLKQALGSNGVGQKDWAERVGGALAAVEEAVRRHRDTLEDDEGRVVDVNTPLNPSPVVKRRADGLRRELDGFLEEARALRGKVRDLHAGHAADPTTLAGSLSVAPEGGDLPDFAVFWQRARDLLVGLGHFEEQEADLIQQSITLDLGAGD
jgi:hypothetical protein